MQKGRNTIPLLSIFKLVALRSYRLHFQRQYVRRCVFVNVICCMLDQSFMRHPEWKCRSEIVLLYAFSPRSEQEKSTKLFVHTKTGSLSNRLDCCGWGKFFGLPAAEFVGVPFISLVSVVKSISRVVWAKAAWISQGYIKKMSIKRAAKTAVRKTVPK